MPKAVLTIENETFIRENYLKISGKEMAAQFGCSSTAVYRFMRNSNLLVPKALSRKFALDKLVGRTIVTPEQDVKIKELYLQMPVKTLAKFLNIGDTALTKRMKNLGLVIPAEIIEQRKADSRIKPGAIPANKGKKQVDYMSAEKIELTKATRFKKGNLPPNTYGEPGIITIRRDHQKRGGKPYKYICLEVGNWRPLHQHLWEQEFGKPEKGMCLWFKDGDTMNCVLENLELITRKENRLRNSGHTSLSDGFIVNCIAWRDPELQNEIINKYPELIELKRQQIKLHRALKNGNKSKS